VGDDAEGLGRQRNGRRVSLDDLDVRPASAEPLRPAGVELDRDDAPGPSRERLRQAAAAGAEIEDEVAAPEVGVAHELRRERVGAKEVLATGGASPRLSRAAGDGRSPW